MEALLKDEVHLQERLPSKSGQLLRMCLSHLELYFSHLDGKEHFNPEHLTKFTGILFFFFTIFKKSILRSASLFPILGV